MARSGRMMAVALAVLLLLGLAPAKSNADVYFAGAYGLPGLDWQAVNPRPISESLYTAAYGNGTWVAVSDHHIYRSDNGDNWEVAAPLVTDRQDLIRAVFAGGRFLVTTGKASLVSTDGRNWTDAAGLTDIVQGKLGCLGMAGEKGVVAADCTTWHDAGLPEPVERVFAAGAMFFAVGKYDHFFVSGDGTTWRQISEARRLSPDFMAYAGGQYLLFLDNGEFAVAADGLTWGPWQWVNGQVPNSVQGIAPVESGLLLVQRDGIVYHSANGVNWEISAQLPGRKWWALASSGDQVLLVGLEGAITHSADGRTWTQVTGGPVHPWGAVVFAQGRFVVMAAVAGTPLLHTSADGVNWQLQRLVLTRPNKWGRLAYTGGRFILFGDEGVSLVSADGLTWEAPGGPLATGRVLSESGPLILAGQNGLQVSTDGAEFRALKAPGIEARSGIFADGRYVLVGGRQIATSTDGKNWTTVAVDARDGLAGVVAGNGRYVAFGVPGEVFVSADGQTWDKVPDLRAYRVQYAGDQFVALSGNWTEFSTDGRTWTNYYHQPQVNGVAFGNGRHVAVGGGGLIMADGAAATPTASPAPAADPVRSTITVDAAENVGQPYMVTVTLRDAAGRPLAGLPVLLESFRYDVSAQVLRTNSQGQAFFRFLSHAADHANTYWAQDVLSGRWLTGTVTTTPRTCGSRFADVPASDEACMAVEAAVARGALSGYPDGTFGPDRPLTRAELAKVALVAAGGTAQPDGALPFADAANHWAARAGYIQGAAALGLMKGDPNGAFRPDAPVSRAELIKVMTVLAGQAPGQGTATYADVSPDDWFAPWAATALRYSLIGTKARSAVYPETEPLADGQPATRVDVACLLNNLYQLRFNQAQPASYQ